ncbi:ABC transporter permease [Epibacterium sp. Ofav1-8]|uniref:ABC transporter permease n=1 Tax=Epibacterium sp. Ofav1-8 TaxID=2917735 RepID=UPI001EF71502|nr:ABC transporter permease [Epibacterium sp. Ofav1-8]MCG7625157.1 ABC transporter permease [Epibacterium sp. Ofav1-8]
MTRSQFAYILPVLLFLVLLYFLPMFKIVGISLEFPDFDLKHYVKLYESNAVRRIAWTTFVICTATTIITVFLSYILAYDLRFASPGRQKFMFMLVLLPLWTSALIRCVAWLILLRQNGLVNEALMFVGAIDTPLELVRNKIGVIVGMVHFLVPFAVLTLYASFRDIDERLMQASRSLGGRRIDTLSKVFLPLSATGVLQAVTLTFVFSLGFYVTPALLGGGRTVMLSEYVSVSVLQTLRWGLGTAICIVLAVLCIGLVLLSQRAIKRWNGAVA